MKILVLLHEEDPDAWLRASAQERQAAFDRHRAFDAAVEERGTLLAGAALEETGRARVLHPGADGARTVTDGPFAESTEQLTGMYLVDLPSVEVALELVALLPTGYRVEVRGSVPLEDY
ncbi:YciI family protein [Nocardioides bruguierae]|uniref:YciI family protein n=1 Tax=Nocardioides bruguierae TaxID=2945102 RepID=A0A9X2D5S3_9ACTN|nr:YciI family protein [Nocardioides bruguierae]MCL8024138.1 YciI family protein [Nocardioides bruguierae]MCM0619841.1 YciI family protein [Nocardioides bruguierae]